MKVLVGTSGFAYKEWQGSFYPKDIKAKDMLRYYATQLQSVEINNTFYRMPSESELRHESWYDDEVYEALRARDVALCVADTDEGQMPFQATAGWGYLRLRRVEYTTADLQAWCARIASQPWRDAFVFFKHEDEATGPRLARQFVSMLPS